MRRHEEACRRVDDVVVRMGGTRRRLVVWHSLVASGLVAGTEHMARAGGPLNEDRRRIAQARSPAAGSAAAASGARAWTRPYWRGPRSPAQPAETRQGLDDLRGFLAVRGGAAACQGGGAAGAGDGATGTAAGGSSRRTAACQVEAGDGVGAVRSSTGPVTRERIDPRVGASRGSIGAPADRVAAVIGQDARAADPGSTRARNIDLAALPGPPRPTPAGAA